MAETRETRERRAREAREALAAVHRDGETLGTSSLARVAGRAGKHLSAADVPENDPVEMWGTRIGRVLSVIFVVALVIYLIDAYVLR